MNIGFALQRFQEETVLPMNTNALAVSWNPWSQWTNWMYVRFRAQNWSLGACRSYAKPTGFRHQLLTILRPIILWAGGGARVHRASIHRYQRMLPLSSRMKLPSARRREKPVKSKQHAAGELARIARAKAARSHEPPQLCLWRGSRGRGRWSSRRFWQNFPEGLPWLSRRGFGEVLNFFRWDTHAHSRWRQMAWIVSHTSCSSCSSCLRCLSFFTETIS